MSPVDAALPMTPLIVSNTGINVSKRGCTRVDGIPIVETANQQGLSEERMTAADWASGSSSRSDLPCGPSRFIVPEVKAMGTIRSSVGAHDAVRGSTLCPDLQPPTCVLPFCPPARP